MAEIDSSVYSRIKGLDFSGLAQGIKDGMTLGQMAKDSKLKEDQILRENKMQDNALVKEKQKNSLKFIVDAASNIKDQESLNQYLGQAQKFGYDTSEIGNVYNPETQKKLNFYGNMAISELDKQKLAEQSRHNAVQEKQTAFDNWIKKETLNQKGQSGENLPIDQKRVVTDLAAKNASKIAIKNQIDAVLNEVKDADDSTKLQQYRELIKVLNSTEGSDAVGAEEVKRLASKLEFAAGGLTSGNYGQFGRDIEGFARDARTKSSAIGNAVKANQSIIDESMGRKAKAISDDDMIDMVDAKGGKFKVPKSQKGEAIAAGLSVAKGG